MKLMSYQNSSLNYENEEYIKKYLFEFPDLTITNQRKFIEFEKTG